MTAVDSDIRNKIVRILAPGGNTHGAGCIVSRRGIIVTCAHVVRSVGGAPGSLVLVESDLFSGSARVLPYYWRDRDLEDTAFLQMLSTPSNLDVLTFSISSICAGRKVRSFGFPEISKVDGSWAAAAAIGYVRRTKLDQQILQLDGAFSVRAGYSGGPVFDIETDECVGILTFIAEAEGGSIPSAYVIPTSSLSSVYPRLRRTCREAECTLKKAESFFDDGDFKSAAERCSQALKLAVKSDAITSELAALYLRINSEVNLLISRRGRDDASTERWATDLSRALELHENKGTHLLMVARVSLFLRDFASARTAIAEARKVIASEDAEAVELCRLMLQLCRPAVADGDVDALEEHEPLLTAVLDKAEPLQREFLLVSLISAKVELEQSVDKEVELLVENVESIGEDAAVALLELDSLTRQLMHHKRPEAAIAVARASSELSAKCKDSRRHAQAEDFLASTLVASISNLTEESLPRLKEAIAIRKATEHQLRKDTAELANLPRESLGSLISLIGNRIQDEIRLFRFCEHGAPEVNVWKTLRSECDNLLELMDAKKGIIASDINAFQSYMQCLQGDISAELGHYVDAARRFALAHDVGAKATSVVPELQYRATCDAAYFLSITGDHQRAEAFLAEAASLATTDDQRSNLTRHHEMVVDLREVAEWVRGADALKLVNEAQTQGVRTAIQPTIKRVLTHWDDAGAPCAMLYDYWGRGAFQRIAAGIRGVPDDVIAVDAMNVEQLEQVAQVLCPLFETVLVKWKGPIIRGLGVGEVGMHRASEAGWLCGYGFVNCAETREGMYGIVGWMNSVPQEVVEWLGGPARDLFATGRIIVVPAVSVGCTQEFVGWTDDMLLSRFLKGVVVGVGGGQTDHSSATLDLASVAMPYMGGKSLSMRDLALALDDLGDSITPFRRRILGVLGSQQEMPYEWAKRKSLRLEIEDAIENIRKSLEINIKHTSLDIVGSQLDINAVERSEHVGRAWLTEALYGVTELPEVLKPWVPYWTLKELGGRFNWGALPTNSPNAAHGLLSSWLSPPSRGAGLAAARTH